MSIPTLVEQRLQKLAVSYKTISLPNSMTVQQVAKHLGVASERLLRAVVLTEKGKTVIAILPYHSMLDYKVICDLCEQDFQIVSAATAQKYFARLFEGTLAPVPGLIKAKMVIDRGVLDFDSVLIESGNPNWILELDRSAAHTLWQECEKLEFAYDINRLQVKPYCDPKPGDIEVGFTSTRLKQRIDDTFDLPAMPDIAQDIMKLRVDPSANANKLAKIVMRDPPLAAQVVSWASSPYYGYQGKVDSVETAIARVLGFELVMNLALGISIGKSLRVPVEGPLGVREFWKQAIYTANLAEKLCRAMPAPQRPERGLIYLSGLLHNFGHLLLGHIFPPQFKLVNRSVQANPQVSVEDIEFYILGVTHEEIGAWLMQNWHMPEELIVAVQRHHQEEFWSKHAVYSNLVLVANRVLRRMNIGDASVTEIPESTLKMLSLDESIIEVALQDMRNESQSLDSMANQLVA